MGRRKSDPFEFLSDELEWNSFEEDLQEKEVASTFIEHKLPTFNAIRYRGTFGDWIRQYSEAIIPGGFHWDEVSTAIIQNLEETALTRGGNLLLAMSPRCGKSASLCLIASFLVARYGFNVLWVSGSARIAELNAKNVMQILQFAGYKLHPQHASFKSVGIACQNTGKVMSLGLGSSVLSLEAHCLIVDDAVTKSEDLNSEVFREKLRTTWEQDLLSRRTKKVVNSKVMGQSVIVSAQRLPSDFGDQASMIIEKSKGASKHGYKDNWKVLEIPLVYPEDKDEWEEFLRRSEYPEWWKVQRLDPDGRWGQPTSSRVTPQEVLEKRFSMSDRAWRAMYLCQVWDNGTSGWSTDWLRPVREAEIHCPVKVLSVDPALIGGAGRDGSGLAVMGICGPDSLHRGKLAILYAESYTKPTHTLYDYLVELCSTWKISYLLIEGTGFGPELVRLSREGDLSYHGVNIVATRPRLSKTERLSALSGVYAGGKVVYPEYSPWINTVNKEFVSISRGTSTKRKDDVADCVLSSTEYLSNMIRAGWKTTEVTWGRGQQFERANQGIVQWGRGTHRTALNTFEGQFATNPNNPFPIKATWE